MADTTSLEGKRRICPRVECTFCLKKADKDYTVDCVAKADTDSKCPAVTWLRQSNVISADASAINDKISGLRWGSWLGSAPRSAANEIGVATFLNSGNTPDDIQAGFEEKYAPAAARACRSPHPRRRRLPRRARAARYEAAISASKTVPSDKISLRLAGRTLPGGVFPQEPFDHEMLTGVVTCPSNKMHAIGDLHGDFAAAVDVLSNLGVITATGEDEKTPEGWKWTDINTDCVIVTGDMSDRGHDFLNILHLWRKLEEQSQKEGGKFAFSLGNHELAFNLARESGSFNKEVTVQDFRSFCDSATDHTAAEVKGRRAKWSPFNLEEDLEFEEEDPDPIVPAHPILPELDCDMQEESEAVRAFRLDPIAGDIGRWLFAHPIVIFETTTKSLLLHAGLTEMYLSNFCAATTEACAPAAAVAPGDDMVATKRAIAAINYVAQMAIVQTYDLRSFLLGGKGPSGKPKHVALAKDYKLWGPNAGGSRANGPLWTRAWRAKTSSDAKLAAAEFTGALKRLPAAETMIAGHTIQDTSRVTPYGIFGNGDTAEMWPIEKTAGLNPGTMLAKNSPPFTDAAAPKLFILDIMMSEGFARSKRVSGKCKWFVRTKYKKTRDGITDQHQGIHYHRDALTITTSPKSWTTMCLEGTGADNCQD